MRIGRRSPVLQDKARVAPTEDVPGIEEAVDGPVLLLEVGSTATRAVLLDTVEGRYRFVASATTRTTLYPPTSEVVSGIRGAVAEVERITRRRLLDSSGLIYPDRPDGGLSAAVLTAAEPLRVALVRTAGGIPATLVRSALDASALLWVGSVEVEGSDRPDDSFSERLRELLRSNPDVILVLGPRETSGEQAGGRLEWCLAKALEQSNCAKPVVLFVGAPSLVGWWEDALGGLATFRSVDPSAAGSEDLGIRGELRAVWRNRLADEVAGYGSAQSWVSCPMMPTSEALATALRFLAQQRGCPVWGVDAGSSTSCLIRAVAEHAAVRCAEVGVARRIQWALKGEAFRRLLPNADPDDVRDALWNRSVRPWAVPETREEQDVVQALAREAIRLVRQTAGLGDCRWPRRIGLVVVRGGGLHPVSRPAEVAWAVAEGLQAVGIFELALDRHEMLPGLGLLASIAPQAAAEALLSDGLAVLATMAVAQGGRLGELAARVELRYLDGRRRQVDVLVGQTATLPLGASEVAEMTLAPAPEVDFGWGYGKPVELRVQGGAAGLLIGVRPEPASESFRRRFSRRLVARCRRMIGAVGVR